MNTTIDNKVIEQAIEKGRAKKRADDEFKKAFWALERDIPLMANETFWSKMTTLIIEVIRAIKVGRSMEAVAHNLHCTFLSKDLEKAKEYISFAKTYERTVASLYKPLTELADNEGLGGDSFGDLLDSFPLLGPVTYLEAIENGFKTFDEVKAYALEYDPLKPLFEAEQEALLNFVFRGENYIKQSLKDKAQEVLLWSVHYTCSECSGKVSPTIGVDRLGRCPYCSLDDDYVSEARKRFPL